MKTGAAFILSLTLAAMLAGCGATSRGGRPAPAIYPPAGSQAGELPPLGQAEEIESRAVRPPITGDCGMEEVQHYVGEPRVNVPRAAMPDNYRVVGPDTVVTMEYRADRLTIRVDERDIVVSMACG